MPDDTVTCIHCNGRIRPCDNAGTEATPLCQYCYDNHYTSCIQCGTLLHWDDTCFEGDDPDEDSPLCRRCYSIRKTILHH